MATIKKTRGRPPKIKKITNPVEEIAQPETENGGEESMAIAMYEQSREERIKENQQRMEKLGILDLSRNLKPLKRKNPPKKTSAAPLSASGSPRRSTRLKTIAPVSYSEKRTPKKGEKGMGNVKINIKHGSNPEVYTEEHEKLLGDCKATWTLQVDGFGEDGLRIYDPHEGKSCHQCRQKTLGHRTVCSKCNIVQGQFCGDCLYMRYGENVLEVNENPDWVCPVCRGICNCSRCRRANGWEPTGAIYRKVEKLGFKSVAHYLIQTRGPRANLEEVDGGSPVSATKSLSKAEKETDMPDLNLVPQLDEKTEEKMTDDGKLPDNDLDQDYDYEPLDEDEDDNDDGDDDEDSEAS